MRRLEIGRQNDKWHARGRDKWHATNSHRQVSGFTLLELLLVLAILSIIVSFAMVATGDFGHKRRIQMAANKFKQIITLVEQQAIIEQKIFGVRINGHGYQVFQRISDTINNNNWQVIEGNNLFKFHGWPTKVTSKLRLLANDNAIAKRKNTPQIIITSSGEITPFVIFVSSHEKPALRIIGKANGEINIK